MIRLDQTPKGAKVKFISFHSESMWLEQPKGVQRKAIEILSREIRTHDTQDMLLVDPQSFKELSVLFPTMANEATTFSPEGIVADCWVEIVDDPDENY